MKTQYKIALSAGMLAIAIPMTADAEIVAGWDAWGTGSAVVNANFTNGVTASGTPGGGQTLTFSDGRGGSSDGTFGDLAGPPAASTTVGFDGAALAFANGNSGFFDITITNTSSLDLELDSLVFDTYARRPNAARTYELVVAAGSDITTGTVFTSGSQVVTQNSGTLSSTIHDEITISFAALTDVTLASGESAVLELDFTGGSSTGGHDLYLDNLAVTGNFVPEPTSLALLGLGSLLIARRRR